MNTPLKVLARSMLAGMLLAAGSVNGQVTVTDNFTGATNTMNWIVTGNACLTAGSTTSNGSGQIKACTPTSSVGNSGNTAGEGGYGAGKCANGTQYTTGCFNAGQKDPVGNGALRLTSAQGNQQGAIVYNGSFPSNSGISITFNAVSYDGDKQNGDGADIIGFFLLDNSIVTAANAATPAYTTISGSWGGSGGYTCSNSNSPYTGSLGGYVGLGIDEFGNFLNSSDNTASGVTAPNSSGVGPVAFGAGTQHVQRIGLRGIGGINPYQLTANFPTYYPSSASTSQLQQTCQTGTVWNNSSSATSSVSTGNLGGATFNGKISSNTTLTVQAGSVSPSSASVLVGQPVTGSGVASGQSICGVTTQVSSSVNGVYTLCTSQSNIGSYESMGAPTCSTGSSACASTVGPVASGANTNCAVMYNNTTGGWLPITYSQLSTAQPSYYPSSLNAAQQSAAVVSTCETGMLWNYSTPATPLNTWTLVTGTNVPNTQTLYDYVPLANANLAFPGGVDTSGNPLANETAGARGNAVMRTYNLKITTAGLLSLTYADDNATTGAPGTAVPVLSNSPILLGNGPLPLNFTFGFAASTGGSNNIHEITCFQAAPADTSGSSAGVNVVQTGQVKTGSQIYLAYYHASDWWGQLTSQNLVYASGILTVQSNANWDASCELTGDTPSTASSTLPGGICQATYVAPPGTSTIPAYSANVDTAQPPLSPTTANGRQIITSNGTSNNGGGGVPFEWASLSTAQQTALTGTDSSTVAQERLSYLRGDRTKEVAVSSTGAVTGIFRTRVGVLGDIIDSSPTWVGQPLHQYPSGAGVTATSWIDLLNPTVTMPENSNTYGAFQAANVSRVNMVFAGANDGMMHGFEAGNNSGTGAFQYTPFNTGQEVLAYMPNAVINTIHNATTQSLDYSSPNYAHNYYVDSTPDIDDLYFNGAWHTWLVSGLGAGGNALFALDITSPGTAATSPIFSETNAASLLVGEWSSATTGLGNNLGQIYGTPSVKRLHSGNWAIIFGNGYNSPNGVGGIFVGLVNPTTGAVTYTFLSTGAGSTSTPNGIMNIFLADLDGDDIVDYIYAGDLLGNVWRWDVTQTYGTATANYATAPTTAAAWATNVPTPIKLFTTASNQPISTQVQVVAVAGTGSRERLMVEFGTGEQIYTTPTSTTYSTTQQAIYGIWDGNMTSWNAKATAGNQYVPFPSGTQTNAVTQPYTVLAAGLEAQTDTSASTSTYRVLSANTVCWSNQSSCSTNAQYGWVYNLPASLEQLIYNPVVQDGALVFNSYIPATNLACTTNNPTGWTMALNPSTGGTFTTSFFGSSAGYGSGGTTSATNSVVSGLNLGASGSPSFVVDNSVSYLITQTLGAPAPGSSGSAAAAATVAADQTALNNAQTALATAQANFAAGTGTQAQLNAAQANATAAATALAIAEAALGAFVTQVNVAPGPGYRLNWQEIR